MKAVMVDITNDEAYSFHNMKHFWYAEAFCTANTHWLNSAAIKISIWLKCERLWQIRWLSILSAVGVFAVVFWWIHSLKETFLQVILFSALLLNPYVLDYFCIARGYSQGLFLEMLALFFFLNKERRRDFPALLCAGFSAIANYSFTYFFIAFLMIYFSRKYFSDRKFLKSKLFYRDLGFAIFILAAIGRAIRFISDCSNDIVGAGTNDFVTFTHVFTLGLSGERFSFSAPALNTVSVAIFALVLLSSFYGVLRVRKTPVYFFTSIILLVMIALIMVARFIFDTVLPEYRSCLFLFPASAICVSYFLFEILKKGKIILYAISAALLVNFILSVKMNSVSDYREYADTRKSLDLLKELKAENAGMSPQQYGGFINYYQMTEELKYNFSGEQLNTYDPKGMSSKENYLQKFDYIILFPPYNLSYYKNSNVKFEGVQMFKETGTLVLHVRN
jgi:hypothetical protein